MMKRYIYVASVLVLSFAACKSPLDKEFNRESAEADFTRIVKIRALDSTEAAIMAHFMVDHDLIGAQVLEIGSTYRDILTEAKAYWEQSNDKSMGEEKVVIDDTKLQELKANVNLTLDATANVTQSQWSHSLEYNTSLNNLSGKNIKAIKGKIEFYDVFGELQHIVDYRYLDPLKSGQVVNDKVLFRFKIEVTSEKVIQYKNTNPFSVVWVPTSVIFEDGSKIE